VNLETKNALANVKAAMMDNPIIKNNLIAKGVIDADGNTVKDANGRDYFDLLLLGVKDGNRSIDSYRPGPTATSGSSKGSKRGSRSTSNVVDTTTDSTGNKTQVLNTGQSIKTSVDGTVTVTDPDGTVSRTMPNGDVVSTTTEGKVTRREGAAAEFRAAAKAATTSAPVVQKAESKSSSKGSKSAPTSEYVVKAGGEINIPDNIAPTGGGIISTPGEPFTPVSIFTPKKKYKYIVLCRRCSGCRQNVVMRRFLLRNQLQLLRQAKLQVVLFRLRKKLAELLQMKRKKPLKKQY
jgi:hypothetical protein